MCLLSVSVVVTVGHVFFFFKQKTAYEMRISDWSSDVCSSDLAVSPQQVSNLINKDDALVIDLRSGEAFRKGHIHGSENVPEDKFDGELVRLGKLAGRPIILVCELGSQSAAAGRKLMAKKVKPVYRLKGGLDAWLGSNLPVVKG